MRAVAAKMHFSASIRSCSFGIRLKFCPYPSPLFSPLQSRPIRSHRTWNGPNVRSFLLLDLKDCRHPVKSGPMRCDGWNEKKLCQTIRKWSEEGEKRSICADKMSFVRRRDMIMSNISKFSPTCAVARDMTSPHMPPPPLLIFPVSYHVVHI